MLKITREAKLSSLSDITFSVLTHKQTILSYHASHRVIVRNNRENLTHECAYLILFFCLSVFHYFWSPLVDVWYFHYFNIYSKYSLYIKLNVTFPFQLDWTESRLIKVQFYITDPHIISTNNDKQIIVIDILVDLDPQVHEWSRVRETHTLFCIVINLSIQRNVNSFYHVK